MKENILKEILTTLKELLGVSKEHKEISKKIEKETLSKKEQRFWHIFAISVIIIIAVMGGIIISLSLGNSSNEPLKISISPFEIKLNENGNINFEINFTNIGEKNISNFDILKIDLYREEKGELIYKRQIKIPWENKDYSISCRNGWIEDNEPNLKVGNSCTVKVDMYSCPECFDDKDKNVYLLIYIDSVPPIENQMVNIPIYRFFPYLAKKTYSQFFYQ